MAQATRGRKTHPGTIERRGRSHRVILYAAGQRYAFTLPTRDRREAVAFAKQKAAELERHALAVRCSVVGPLRFSALLDRYETDLLPLKADNTRSTYAHSLATFRVFFCDLFGNPRVEAIHEGHVREFLTW